MNPSGIDELLLGFPVVLLLIETIQPGEAMIAIDNGYHNNRTSDVNQITILRNQRRVWSSIIIHGFNARQYERSVSDSDNKKYKQQHSMARSTHQVCVFHVKPGATHAKVQTGLS